MLWVRSKVRIGWEVGERKRMLEPDVISIGIVVGGVCASAGVLSEGMPR